ncbi:MAG: hypothetical protein BWZ01_02168 [Deltaproteobacteria bacterium ADurb.BinA179]|nr:MAG: hypothetical protein BWZ01_02168 [Deltaproteobacteria bacterium ADurb.BinA179]
MILSMEVPRNRSMPTESTAASRAEHPTIFPHTLVTSAPMTSRAPVVAGPMVMGMARGTTVMLSGSSGRTVTSVPRTRSTAERKSRAPAPTRKASRVIPKTEKMALPRKYRTRPMRMTSNVSHAATVRRLAGGMSRVSERNTERTKNGVSRKKSLI